MKVLLVAMTLLMSMSSAFALDGYLNCKYTEHVIINLPENESVLELSASVSKKGSRDIIQRIGRVTIIAEVENFRTISLKLVDTLDHAKIKKTVEPNTAVTISLPEAHGTTRAGHSYKNVTLSCRLVTM